MLVSEQGAKHRRRDPQLLGLFGFEFGNDDGGTGLSFSSTSAGSQFGSSLPKSVRAVTMT